MKGDTNTMSRQGKGTKMSTFHIWSLPSGDNRITAIASRGEWVRWSQWCMGVPLYACRAQLCAARCALSVLSALRHVLCICSCFSLTVCLFISFSLIFFFLTYFFFFTRCLIYTLPSAYYTLHCVIFYTLNWR